jgi:hypothetical protein
MFNDIIFDDLVDKGIFYITYPHDEEGWDLSDDREWSFSIISLVNILDNHIDNWTKDAPKYTKPQSYNYAKSVFPKLLGTEKYIQILESIKIYEQKYS